MWIYILTNKITKKKYVGQTTRYPLKRNGRIDEHFKSKKGCTALCRSIKKYGRSAFTHEVQHHPGITQLELDEIEKSLILSLNTVAPNGYNLKSGGNSNGEHTPETKALISQKLKGKKRTPEQKKANSERNRGRRQTDETKRKISKALKGRIPWNKGQEAWNKGKQNIYTSETLEKMSHAARNRKSKIAVHEGQMSFF